MAVSSDRRNTRGFRELGWLVAGRVRRHRRRGGSGSRRLAAPGSLGALERDISAPNLSGTSASPSQRCIDAIRRRGVAGAGDRGRAGPGPGDGQPGTAPQPGSRVSGQYRPFTAQRLPVSGRARPGRDKLMRDPVLRQFVADRMGKRWRPKQISHAQRVPRQSRPAHRARDDLPGATPRSPEPSLAALHPRAPQRHSQIYQAVRRTELGGLCRDLPKVLGTGRRRRKQRRRLGARRAGSLAGMTMIDQRPNEADSRDIPGHWECEWCCQATLARSGGAAA